MVYGGWIGWSKLKRFIEGVGGRTLSFRGWWRLTAGGVVDWWLVWGGCVVLFVCGRIVIGNKKIKKVKKGVDSWG